MEILFFQKMEKLFEINKSLMNILIKNVKKKMKKNQKQQRMSQINQSQNYKNNRVLKNKKKNNFRIKNKMRMIIKKKENKEK